MINSPGVMKGIITRLPKRSRDELAKRLCQVNEHLPDFEFLLKFVEGQLRLVSHPVMNIVKDSKSNDTNLDWKSKTERFFVIKDINAVITNARSHMHNVGDSRAMKCVVLGCSSTSNHHFWRRDEFRKLILRDRWSLAKKVDAVTNASMLVTIKMTVSTNILVIFVKEMTITIFCVIQSLTKTIMTLVTVQRGQVT